MVGVGMVVVGVDAHKRTHTLVAVDQVGRKLGERTVATSSDGHLQAVRWAAQWPQVTFALHPFMQNIRRAHYELAIEEPATLRLAVAFDELALAI
jgi:transposase